jgi:hypothetical protein
MYRRHEVFASFEVGSEVQFEVETQLGCDRVGYAKLYYGWPGAIE